MTEQGFSLKSIQAWRQGLVVLVLLLVFDLASFASNQSSPSAKFGQNIWTNAVAMILFYIIVNSLVSLASEKPIEYVRNSIYTFLGICIIGGLISWAISGQTIDEAGSFKWLFVVLSLGYLIFLSIISTMKFIVKLAQKQDSRLRGE